jgi:hypothetical protein
MARATDSNECHRCPDHGSLRVDGPLTLKLCQRCWLEWQGSAVRGVVQNRVRVWLDFRHEEAAPRNIKNDLTE